MNIIIICCLMIWNAVERLTRDIYAHSPRIHVSHSFRFEHSHAFSWYGCTLECVCTCIECSHTQLCPWVWKPEVDALCIFSIVLHAIFWDKASHWTWSLSVCPKWLTVNRAFLFLPSLFSLTLGCKHVFFLFFEAFFETGFLSSFGVLPWTSSELIEICLPLPPECLDWRHAPPPPG